MSNSKILIFVPIKLEISKTIKHQSSMKSLILIDEQYLLKFSHQRWFPPSVEFFFLSRFNSSIDHPCQQRQRTAILTCSLNATKEADSPLGTVSQLLMSNNLSFTTCCAYSRHKCSKPHRVQLATCGHIFTKINESFASLL